MQSQLLSVTPAFGTSSISILELSGSVNQEQDELLNTADELNVTNANICMEAGTSGEKDR